MSAALAPPALPSPNTGAERLRIGGLAPLTSIDYPGELAAVIFCQGCPWRCRYCHNGHLLPAHGPDFVSWAQVRGSLGRRQGLLDAVVFSGGEPTLQAALPAAMAEVKALGFKVGLHTAGPYPERLRRVLPWLDWVGMDIKALPEDYASVTGVPRSGEAAWESLELLLGTGIALEVRTTPMPGLDYPDYLDVLMRRLAIAGVRDYVVQGCRTDHSFDPGLRRQTPAPIPGRTRIPMDRPQSVAA
jgi:pyruvate formate lyase activating enzyme